MQKKKYNILLSIIIIGAIVARLFYVIKMPYKEKQHDIDPNRNGALAYAYTIYEAGHLPENNSNQYYHPPFHHILSAGWMKMISIITSNADKDFLFESLQFLTVIYSMGILLVSYKIFKELKLSKKIRLLLMLIISFHPSLIILSGSLNNDELCFLLMLWSLLRLIKWYKKDNVKNTVLLAIIVGLCVMTKISGAIIAIPILYVFIQKVYREMKRTKNRGDIIKKYILLAIIFIIISLPIGLWFAIRNYILFNQNLMYIPKPSDSLYVGNYSIVQRISPLSKENTQLYCAPFEDYNMIAYLLKSSLFGEYKWGNSQIEIIAYNIALITNAILIIYSLYCLIKNFITKNKRNFVWKKTIFLLFITNLISYIVVNLKMPYGCTMDFRYVFPILFAGITFIGIELNNKNKYSNIVYTILVILTIILLITTNGIIFS